MFEDDELVVERSTTARDVDGWDSLRHVTLILQVEHVFSIRFPSSKVASLADVGELVDLVEKLSAS